MTTALVYTDGSCLQGQTATGHVYRSGYGGWAAVCEHGHDGWVVRGRSRNTSNVAMELVAVVQGLASLPPGVPARVYTDSTLLLVIYDWWCRVPQRPTRARHPKPPRHYRLWLAVAAELDARTVEFELVRKHGPRAVQLAHRRAHVFAQYEARTARHVHEGGGQAPQEPVLRLVGQAAPQQVRSAVQDARRHVLQGLQARPVAADPLAVPGGKPRWAGVRNRGGRMRG